MYYNMGYNQAVDVTSVKQLDIKSRSIISGGCHSFICVLEGTGNAALNSEEFEIRQDDLFILRPIDLLSVEPDKSTELHMIHVTFRISNQKLVNDIERCYPKQSISDGIYRQILLKMLNDAVMKPPLYRDSINLYAASLLLEIIRKDNAHSEQKTSKRRMTPSPAGFNLDLYKLVEYIEDHIDTTITIKMLADHIQSTPATVYKLFKQGFNVTPLQYINSVRLNKAKELMRSTDLNITEVAMRTGFNSIHYFSRYFKEKEKMTPLEFREQLSKSIS